jgi:hypothetical protein
MELKNIKSQNSEIIRKKRAAAAAVGVALALEAERNTIQEFPIPERVVVSAWQAVLRSNSHSTRGNLR